MAQSNVAFVTGASRGIGREIVVALAKAGFDVALTARTVREGEGRDDGDISKGKRAIAGSIEASAALVEKEGRKALPVAMDLRDLASVRSAFNRVEREWGRVDVLVNNGMFHGGNMTDMKDLSIEALELNMRANTLAPMLLIELALPGMLSRGNGTIVNFSSGAAFGDPAAIPSKGGVGVAYSMSKAALHRVAGYAALEFGGRGICCFNIEPGYVATQVVVALPGAEARASFAGPATVPASVVAWLAISPDARALNGQSIKSRTFALEKGLHPKWD